MLTISLDRSHSCYPFRLLITEKICSGSRMRQTIRNRGRIWETWGGTREHGSVHERSKGRLTGIPSASPEFPSIGSSEWCAVPWGCVSLSSSDTWHPFTRQLCIQHSAHARPCSSRGHAAKSRQDTMALVGLTLYRGEAENKGIGKLSDLLEGKPWRK